MTKDLFLLLSLSVVGICAITGTVEVLEQTSVPHDAQQLQPLQQASQVLSLLGDDASSIKAGAEAYASLAPSTAMPELPASTAVINASSVPSFDVLANYFSSF